MNGNGSGGARRHRDVPGAGGAPGGRATPAGGGAPQRPVTGTASVARWVWSALAVTVVVELALGVAALLVVPAGRPSGLVPRRGVVVYDLHAALGGVLVVGAAWLVLRARHAPRVERAAAVVGLVAVVIAAGGGLLAASHPERLLGLALMFAGSVLAGLAFLAGAFERTPAVGTTGTA